jgi:hypothetical protein
LCQNVGYATKKRGRVGVVREQRETSGSERVVIERNAEGENLGLERAREGEREKRRGGGVFARERKRREKGKGKARENFF